MPQDLEKDRDQTPSLRCDLGVVRVTNMTMPPSSISETLQVQLMGPFTALRRPHSLFSSILSCSQLFLWAFAPPSIVVVVMFSRLREPLCCCCGPSSDPSRHLFFRRCCGMSFFCSRHLSSTCCGLSSRPSDPSRPLFFRRYCGRRPIPLVHLFLDVVVRCHSSPLVIRRLCLTLLWAVLV